MNVKSFFFWGLQLVVSLLPHLGVGSVADGSLSPLGQLCAQLESRDLDFESMTYWVKEISKAIL